jgi:hypothetical protein
VTDKKQTRSDQEWLDKLSDADSVRSYRPVRGPEEPAEAPSGRASASTQPGDTAQPGDKGAEHHASSADQDG